MPVSDIQAIPAHPQANSYATVAEADQYFSDRDNSSDWTGASTDTKKKALIEATRLIDALQFHGQKLKRWQALEFPRHTVKVVNGAPDSATSSTIVDADLADRVWLPDDYWNNGALWFTNEGDNNYMEFYSVSDFDAGTGTVTISETFTTTPETTDDYQLIREINTEVKWATCETAVSIIADLLVDQNTTNIKRQSLEDESVEYFNASTQTVKLPGKALHLLKPYISRVGRLISSPTFR